MSEPQDPNKPVLPKRRIVSSLLDHMVDGREYGSLLDLAPQINLRDEISRALSEISGLRGRPLIGYFSNIFRAGDIFTGIELADDLPFAELVASIPLSEKRLDIVLSTPGGSAQQVSSFVQKLRPRFDDVAFIVPHMCMSAGTIWATSGNEIVMDERAFLGPIDPQVPNREGRFVPAQALFALIEEFRKEAEKAVAQNRQPSWAHLQLLRFMDQKELGAALTSTQYAQKLVEDYLVRYKFSSWTTHRSDGATVSDAEKKKTAEDIAKKLSSHDVWKTHGHGIFRSDLWDVLKLQITHPSAELSRSIRRLWAVLCWTFEFTPVQKAFISDGYALFKQKTPKT